MGKAYKSQEAIEKYLAGSLRGCRTIQQRHMDKYHAKPKVCPTCQSILPWEKRANKFCNSSCAATFNNSAVPKRKSTKIEKPCAHCGTITLNPKFCSRECEQSSKYSPMTEEKLIIVRAAKAEVSAKYRASLRNQTPPNADRKAIKEFYLNCPEGYEVDHIIPISKGGLHTLENLQYLTIRENRSKSNKLVPPPGVAPGASGL
jgi:protein-arginine kinase activator protein McsA